MKVVGMQIILFFSCSALSQASANLYSVVNREIVVAQSYCEMCSSGRVSCQLGCNGAGKCIQTCDDQYRECRRQNCHR